MESKRQSAYWILSQVFDNPAEVWHTVKFEVIAREKMTLEEMEPDLALAVAQGLWQKVVLNIDSGPFYTRHSGFGPKEYEEMWETYAT